MTRFIHYISDTLVAECIIIKYALARFFKLLYDISIIDKIMNY